MRRSDRNPLFGDAIPWRMEDLLALQLGLSGGSEVSRLSSDHGRDTIAAEYHDLPPSTKISTTFGSDGEAIGQNHKH